MERNKEKNLWIWFSIFVGVLRIARVEEEFAFNKVVLGMFCWACFVGVGLWKRRTERNSNVQGGREMEGEGWWKEINGFIFEVGKKNRTPFGVVERLRDSSKYFTISIF